MNEMLTTQQQQTLKTYIQSVQALNDLLTIGNMSGLAEELSADHSPAFVVWRDDMTPTISRKAITSGAQLGQLDNLTVGKRDALLYALEESMDCRVEPIRAAIDGLCGTQNTLKDALLAAMKRNATVIEKVFATGTGTTLSPASCVYVGGIGYVDLIGL
jgi:hypothetical protein